MSDATPKCSSISCQDLTSWDDEPSFEKPIRRRGSCPLLTYENPVAEVYATLKEFIESREKLKVVLNALNEEVRVHWKDYKIANVFGTTAGIASTVLTVSGLLLVIPTAGASLALTSAGIGTGAVAATIKIGADIGDALKKRKYLRQLLEQSKESADLGQRLNHLVNTVFFLEKNLNLVGVDTKAQYVDLIKDAAKINVKVLLKSSKLVKDLTKVIQKGALNGAAILAKEAAPDLGAEAIKVGNISKTVAGSAADEGVISFLALMGIKVSQTTLKALAAGTGVAFCALDVALLLKTLFDKHTVSQLIEKTINKIDEELLFLTKVMICHEVHDNDYLKTRTCWRKYLETHGLYEPPFWVTIADCSRCMDCDAEFNLIRRPHHCRHCGGIFCNNHSKGRLPLPKFGTEYDKQLRICDNCYAGLNENRD